MGLKTEARTMKSINYQFICSTCLLTRRFRTDKYHLRYKTWVYVSDPYTLTTSSKRKSIQGYVSGVVYTKKLGFCKFIPIFNENIKNNDRSLSNFIGLFELQGINENFKNGIFKRLIRKFGIFQAFTDLHSPWKNWAEPEIGEIKRYARKIIQASNTLMRLWCFCYEYSKELFSILDNGIFDI